MFSSLPRWLILLLLLLAVLAGREWLQRPVVQPYGLRLAQLPKQQKLDSAASRQLGEFSLQPKARFDIEARVLSAERYRMGISADLAPLDLALGWGIMSDQAIVDQLTISQGARWYILRWGQQAPAPEREIMRSSGNMHIIPADANIRKQAFALRAGEFVRLRGYLVDAQGPGGFRWGTSLSRDDTGDGACELFLVESVEDVIVE
ncbi:MAG TPA: hypothetical protein VJN01_15200 [Xanthomonadales bacterium]|nr:hypothetical protein [Xanthomonadales bacterium]